MNCIDTSFYKTHINSKESRPENGINVTGVFTYLQLQRLFVFATLQNQHCIQYFWNEKDTEVPHLFTKSIAAGCSYFKLQIKIPGSESSSVFN